MPGSGYELFAQRRFRNLWAANFISNLGVVMLLLGVAWTMTSLTDDPVMVAMVQTGMSLPFVIASVPAGIAADALGSRTVLLASQFWLLSVILLTGCIAVPGWWTFTPLSLLSLVFLLGAGVAVQQIAWKPFLQDQVGEDRLIAAISFNSLSSDLGRTVGPAIGGYLMGFFGSAVVIFAGAVSQVAMIATLRSIPRSSSSEPRGDDTVPARQSLRHGWAHLRQSPSLRAPMIRCAMFMAPCGGLLGLLPLEAKENIQTGPIGYGGLLTALGIGTAVGGALMPLLQRNLGFVALTTVPLAGFALAMIGISQWDSMLLDAGFLLVLGFCWCLLSIAHQFAVQIAAPEHLRGLMNSIYGLILRGSMAAGSVIFGLVAQHAGVSRSILVAGLVALGGLLLGGHYPLRDTAAEPSSTRLG